MNTLAIALVSLAGYLIGSVSFAVLVARAKGIDIFTEGSGNPGATNVKRTLGARAGNLVFVMDALKGTVAAGWPLLFFGDDGLHLGIIGLVAAIFGHSYSVFLRFRGGKGVATTMGGLLAVMPLALLAGVVLWLLVFAISRMVGLASIVFALSLPVSAGWLYAQDDPRFTLAVLLAILIVLRHRSNIARILQGKETKFGR